MRDLHELPKLRDGLGYLYVEHARIEQDHLSVAIADEDAHTPIPAASLAILMLGPGTTITHAAIKALVDNGCSLCWCGEGMVRFYAQGIGETRKAAKIIRQAELVSDKEKRLKVVVRMYRMRFTEKLSPELTIEQIRGMEGVRIRDAYAQWSKMTGVPWHGRKFERGNWKAADPVNRALSAANSCLYGLCHAGIVSAGYSSALGFVHCGKQLSFVYDIADLYKTETTIPVAFAVAAENPPNLETVVRKLCRNLFYEKKILQRIIPDIEKALDIERDWEDVPKEDVDVDGSIPSGLWDPELGKLKGGINYGGDHSGKSADEPEGGTEPVDD